MPDIDHEEYEAIRREVSRRLLRWGVLGAHAILWGVGSGIGVLLSGGMEAVFDNSPILYISILWLGLVCLHALLVILLEVRDFIVRREIKQRHEAPIKLKRDRLYRLTDDGELVEEEAPEDETRQQISARR
jgi:hypothetical protein